MVSGIAADGRVYEQDFPFQDAMPSDDNQPFLRMDDFSQFQGYGPQPSMPWESYGIMDPFSKTVPSMYVEKKPAAAAEKNPPAVQSTPLEPDALRSKVRDSLTEALKMVAGELSKEELEGFFFGGGGGGAATVDGFDEFDTMVDEATFAPGVLPHAKRSKLQVFGGKGSDPPCKKMKLEDRSVGFLDDRVAEHAKSVSKNIEIELLRYFRAVNKKYREKFRSLLFNLKDKNNPDLRARVFVGEVGPEQLCSMTTEELASKELSQWRLAKAEEREQKVVITDEDVNPSKIVKKTHKGEIIMEVADSEAPAAPVKEVQGGAASPGPSPSRSPSPSSSPSANQDAQEGEVEQEDGVEEAGGDGDSEREDGNDSEMVEAAATTEEEAAPASGGAALAAEEDAAAVDGVVGGDAAAKMDDSSTDPLLDVSDFKGLPEIMSMDGFLKSMGCATTGDDQKNADAVDAVDYEKNDDGEEDHKASTTRSLKRKHGDGGGGERKHENSSSRKNSEESAKVAAPLWEGSLQLTGTRSTAVHGMFRSGRCDVKLESWPKQLEVKGRVKLGPLAKFLKDLCNSKSRAVTVVSFFSSDMATSSLSLLKEVADLYEKGERVGYVEPGTGYELYLFPPGKATWKFLTENGRLKPSSDLPKDKSEVLVGCVVWRKNPSDKGSKPSSTPAAAADKSKRGSSSSSKAPSSKHSRGKHSSASTAATTAATSSVAKSGAATTTATVPVSQQQSQSVVTHSVNEWHPQQQHQPSLESGLFPPHHHPHLAPPPPPPFLAGQPPPLPPPEGLPLPPGFHPGSLVHLSQVLGALLPGAKLPGYEGPPGFWQQQQQQQHQQQKDGGGNDLPEFDYEGHVPMSRAGSTGVAPPGMNMGVGRGGGGSFHPPGFLPPAEPPYVLPPASSAAAAVSSEGMGMQWPPPRTGGSQAHQHQLQVRGKHQEQHQQQHQHQQQQMDSSSNAGGFPALRPPLPPGPPPAPAGGASAAANPSYGQWIHPNQAAQQKTMHYKKASVVAPPPQQHQQQQHQQQRRHRS